MEEVDVSVVGKQGRVLAPDVEDNLDGKDNKYVWIQAQGEPNRKVGIVHNGVSYSLWFNPNDNKGYVVQTGDGKTNVFGDHRWYTNPEMAIRAIKNIKPGVVGSKKRKAPLDTVVKSKK